MHRTTCETGHGETGGWIRKGYQRMGIYATQITRLGNILQRRRLVIRLWDGEMRQLYP